MKKRLACILFVEEEIICCDGVEVGRRNGNSRTDEQIDINKKDNELKNPVTFFRYLNWYIYGIKKYI